MSAKRKKKLKTAARTHIISSGLRTDHTTPSTLRRYFSLKSREMSEVSVNQFRSNAFFEASVSAMRANLRCIVWASGPV